MNCKVTGIVGTAKNTGKTTTLTYLVESAAQKKIKTAVTGIGYDGEEFDNITSLPKPRLLLPTGTITATSETCLAGMKDCYELLERTEFETALGQISIIKITKPNLFVIAGPNSRSILSEVLDRISSYNPERILIDGSLNRISPIYLADEIIFTTGGARNTNISALVTEMKIIEKIFSYPKNKLEGAVYFYPDITSVESDFIPDFSSKKIFIKHPVQLNHLKKILEKNNEVIFHSPIYLLLSGNLTELYDFLSSEKLKLTYLYKPELKAVTVNPFYPVYKGLSYSEGFINADQLLREMKENLSIPVYNIKTDNPQF